TRGETLRQVDQLRADLRDVGVRPRAAARSGARHRAGLHRKLLHPLSGCRKVHGGSAPDGARPRLRRDGVREAPVAARDQELQPRAPRRGRARRDQRAHAGHGRGPDQARDDRRAGVARPREAFDQAHHAGARRAGARGAGGRTCPREGRDPRADERRGKTQGPPCRGRGIGTELGKGALKRPQQNPSGPEEDDVTPNSLQEEQNSPDVIRHLVLLGDALDTLAAAADEFENTFSRLIAAAAEAGVPTIVCTLVPARYTEPSRQRVGATALAIFNDRILRRTVAARLSIVELRLICDEDSDYASETLLSHAGVRKVANVARSALYDISRNP